MNRTDVTYGQLDKVLRSLGFSCRLVKKEAESRRYEHQASGALILLPAFPEHDQVLEYHLVTVRVTLDNFGIADPTAFAAKLQKAG
jgi:hypothetical protein